MARTVAPGNPLDVKGAQFNTPGVDFSVFEKMGDASIKNANQNLELYAKTATKSVMQQIARDYKANPVGLANAIGKVPDIVADMPDAIKNKAMVDIAVDGSTLIAKAATEQQKQIAKQNELMAKANADLGHKQLADDYFNVLTYISAADEDKRPGDVDAYNVHKIQLAQLAYTTDDNDNYIFSDAQRKRMIQPKEAQIAGFKDYIYRMSPEELDEWEKNVFANSDKFIADTGIDGETYESMAMALKRAKGYKQLESRRQSDANKHAAFQDFVANPTQTTIDNYKALPEYSSSPEFKKMTDAMQDWYDKQGNVSMAEATTIDPNKIFNALALLNELQDGNATPENLFTAYYQDLAALHEADNITQNDIDLYAEAAKNVIGDKSFAHQYNYLVNKAADYFPAKASAPLYETGSGFTAKSLRDKYNEYQANAFAAATRAIIEDNGDPTRALQLYIAAQDGLYKNNLLRAGIDLADLERKRQNKQDAYFVLNGIPQEYLGRDDNGVIVSRPAWEKVQIPSMPQSTAEQAARKRWYETAKKRGLAINPQIIRTQEQFNVFGLDEDGEKSI